MKICEELYNSFYNTKHIYPTLINNKVEHMPLVYHLGTNSMYESIISQANPYLEHTNEDLIYYMKKDLSPQFIPINQDAKFYVLLNNKDIVYLSEHMLNFYEEYLIIPIREHFKKVWGVWHENKKSNGDIFFHKIDMNYKPVRAKASEYNIDSYPEKIN